MTPLTRRCAAWSLILLGGIWVAWLGGHPEDLGDYGTYFAPSMNALLAGHLHAFSHLLPPDAAGGSVILRAPAALVGKLAVGGQHAMYRFGALACELAAGGLGLVLARDMRERGLPLVSRVATVGLCVLAAAILDAIFFDHPEETLGAALSIGAVLLSGANRPTLAGLALGCALINKPWGILAVPSVVLASQSGLRRVCVGSLAVLVPWLALAYGLDPARFLHSLNTAASQVGVAHPVGVWWPLDHAVREPGITPYYAPPVFLIEHAREIPVLLAIPLSLPLAMSRLAGLRPPNATGRHLAGVRRIAVGDRAGTDAALALLALLFLLRCMLDPSNHVYYQVPFVLALLAWETRISRWPIRALLAVGLLWLVFHTVSGLGSLSVQYVAYMLVTLPFAILLLGPATAGAVRWPKLPLWHGTARTAPSSRAA